MSKIVRLVPAGAAVEKDIDTFANLVNQWQRQALYEQNQKTAEEAAIERAEAEAEAAEKEARQEKVKARVLVVLQLIIAAFALVGAATVAQWLA